MHKAAVALVAMFVVLGCGDAESTDTRGYTKAPLEEAGVVIKSEGTSAMDSLGTPVLPRDTLIPVETVPATTTTR